MFNSITILNEVGKSHVEQLDRLDDEIKDAKQNVNDVMIEAIKSLFNNYPLNDGFKLYFNRFSVNLDYYTKDQDGDDTHINIGVVRFVEPWYRGDEARIEYQFSSFSPSNVRHMEPFSIDNFVDGCNLLRQLVKRFEDNLDAIKGIYNEAKEKVNVIQKERNITHNELQDMKYAARMRNYDRIMDVLRSAKDEFVDFSSLLEDGHINHKIERTSSDWMTFSGLKLIKESPKTLLFKEAYQIRDWNDNHAIKIREANDEVRINKDDFLDQMQGLIQRAKLINLI